MDQAGERPGREGRTGAHGVQLEQERCPGDRLGTRVGGRRRRGIGGRVLPGDDVVLDVHHPRTRAGAVDAVRGAHHLVVRPAVPVEPLPLRVALTEDGGPSADISRRVSSLRRPAASPRPRAAARGARFCRSPWSRTLGVDRSQPAQLPTDSDEGPLAHIDGLIGRRAGATPCPTLVADRSGGVPCTTAPSARSAVSIAVPRGGRRARAGSVTVRPPAASALTPGRPDAHPRSNAYGGPGERRTSDPPTAPERRGQAVHRDLGVQARLPPGLPAQPARPALQGHPAPELVPAVAAGGGAGGGRLTWDGSRWAR